MDAVGAIPRYTPEGIKDPLVRGFVNSATRYALAQKKPSDAVREFSKELGKAEFARFEQKYKVPAARLKHQLRSKHTGEMLEETRIQLEKLAQDMERAEGYWNRIFAYVTEKYFKSRKSEIQAALKEARWYPYLTAETRIEVWNSRKRENIKHFDDLAAVVRFFPTDKRERERYAKFREALRIEPTEGWIFLRNYFGAASEKGKQTCCMITENIQRVKISKTLALIASKRSAYDIKPMPEEILEDPSIALEEESLRNPTEKDRLIFELHDKQEKMELISQGKLDFEIEAILDTLAEISGIIKALEKYEETGEVRRKLKKWLQGMPSKKELERKTRLYSPPAFYPLDFLPALLATMYAMEKTNPVEMARTKALLLDMKGVMTQGPDAYTKRDERPKEMQDYLKLAKAIGARDIGHNRHIAAFGQGK